MGDFDSNLKEANRQLELNVTFQQTLLELAQEFINVHDYGDYSRTYSDLLEKIGKALNADRSYIFLHDYTRNISTNTVEWVRDGVSREIQNLQEVSLTLYAPILEKHRQKEAYSCESIVSLQTAYPALYKHLAHQNIESFIMLPVSSKSELLGIIGFDIVDKCKQFSGFEVKLLKVAAQMLANVMQRESDKKEIQKKTEVTAQYLKELEQHKEKLVNVIQATNVATWEWWVQTGKTVFDEYWAAILGYKLEELGNYSIKTWEKMVHPDDLDSVTVALSNYFEGRTPIYDTVYRMKHKKGQWVWISDKGKVTQWDENGKPLLMFGTHLDITDKHQAQLDLIQSEERFRFAFKNSLASMFIIDPRTRKFVDVNDSAIAFYSYSRIEFLQKTINDINVFTSAKIGEEIEKLMQEGKRKFDFQHRLATGEIRNVEVYSSVIYTKGLPYLHSIVFDVTTRKKVQERLITNMKEISYYKFALDQSALVSMSDIKGNITYVNSSLCKKSGFTHAELVGSNHRIFNSGEHDKSFYKQMWDTILAGNVWRGQVKNKTKKGTFWWADSTIVPFLNDAGVPTQFMAIRFDITERKQAELELEKRQFFIETTLKYLDVGVCVNRISDRVSTIKNMSFVHICGWSSEHLVTLHDFLTHCKPKDSNNNAICENILFVVENSIQSTYEWKEVRITTESGKQKVVTLRLLVLQEQDVVVLTLTDLTEIFDANEDIRLKNERFSYINKATNDAIYDWNLQTGEIERGEGYARLFGFDYINKNLITDWKEHVHPDDVLPTYTSLMNAISDRNTTNWMHEYRFKHSTNEYLFVLEKGYIIRDKQGNAIRMLGVIQDINAMKQAETQLKEINELLEKNATNLNYINSELEQFVYIASHDLQEPLRMITSFLKLFDDKYGTQLDSQAKKYIFFASDGAKRMRQIILDLLNFSRVGRIEAPESAVNLNIVIDDVKKLLAKQLDESNAQIELETPLPTLFMSASHATHLFQNMLGNAIKYRKQDITSEIRIRCEQLDAQSWHFSIRDNGIGIHQDYFNKIFMLFQRLHTKQEYEGTGVGLAICKKIVEHYSGKIWVESKPEHGSTFHFTLYHLSEV